MIQIHLVLQINMPPLYTAIIKKSRRFVCISCRYNEKVRECVLRSLLCEEAAAMYLNENLNESNV